MVETVDRSLSNYTLKSYNFVSASRTVSLFNYTFKLQFLCALLELYLINRI